MAIGRPTKSRLSLRTKKSWMVYAARAMELALQVARSANRSDLRFGLIDPDFPGTNSSTANALLFYFQYGDAAFLGLCIFSSDQDAGALRAYLLVMRVILGDREDFSGTVADPPVVLGDGEGAGQDKPADREMMSVVAFSRPRLQVLRLNFGVTVGPEICLERVGVHCNAPSLVCP
jgi:hypothetical protein